MLESSVRTWATGDDYGVYSWSSLLVSVFDGGVASLEGMTAMRDATRGFQAEFPRFPSMTVLRGELSMNISPEVRRLSDEVAREFIDVVTATVIVVPATGLRGAFYRSLITGAQLVSRSKAPQTTTKTFHDAVHWICGQQDVGPIEGRADELISALTEFAGPSS